MFVRIKKNGHFPIDRFQYAGDEKYLCKPEPDGEVENRAGAFLKKSGKAAPRLDGGRKTLTGGGKRESQRSWDAPARFCVMRPGAPPKQQDHCGVVAQRVFAAAGPIRARSGPSFVHNR